MTASLKEKPGVAAPGFSLVNMCTCFRFAYGYYSICNLGLQYTFFAPSVLAQLRSVLPP